MVEVYKDNDGQWRWRLTAGEKILAASGEGYRRRGAAVTAWEKVRDLAPKAGLVEILPLRVSR